MTADRGKRPERAWRKALCEEQAKIPKAWETEQTTEIELINALFARRA